MERINVNEIIFAVFVAPGITSRHRDDTLFKKE
jgi:hypothetical protein